MHRSLLNPGPGRARSTATCAFIVHTLLGCVALKTGDIPSPEGSDASTSDGGRASPDGMESGDAGAIRDAIADGPATVDAKVTENDDSGPPDPFWPDASPDESGPPDPVWSDASPAQCATAIASGWLLGCSANQAGDYQVYEWLAPTQVWAVVPNAWALSISVDLRGVPWAVNKAGQVLKWNGSGFEPFGGTAFMATYVASGADDSETWAVQQSDTSIWNWSGAIWQRVSGSFGSKIALFSEVDACGAHVPWVINSSWDVFRYTPAPSCVFPGAFSQVSPAASDITTDLVVGTDNMIRVWKQPADASATFNPYIATPWGAANTRLGGWALGVFALDVANGDVVQLAPP
jgi:hypothetical protein